MIDAPQLEELYLLWSGSKEPGWFDTYPRDETAQIMLNQLRVLDIYGHADS